MYVYEFIVCSMQCYSTIAILGEIANFGESEIFNLWVNFTPDSSKIITGFLTLNSINYAKCNT